MLSRLFNKAEASGYAPVGGNPCRFIKKYPTRSCERFLSEREFVRLGTVLDELEAKGKISATAAAGLRLLMLTGCRRNEILTLRWEDVDLEHDELRLARRQDGRTRGPAVADGETGPGRSAPAAQQSVGHFRAWTWGSPEQSERTVGARS